MFNFHIGKPSKKQIITTSIILSSIIAALSQCSGIHENNLWDIFDEIQRKFFPGGLPGRVITEDPEKIKRRVERDVENAIRRATPEYDRIIREADKKYQPRYVDEVNDESVCYSDECKKLAPPMRICAPWVDSCPKD